MFSTALLFASIATLLSLGILYLLRSSSLHKALTCASIFAVAFGLIPLRLRFPALFLMNQGWNGFILWFSWIMFLSVVAGHYLLPRIEDPIFKNESEEEAPNQHQKIEVAHAAIWRASTGLLIIYGSAFLIALSVFVAQMSS